jgi:hypothetical protein
MRSLRFRCWIGLSNVLLGLAFAENARACATCFGASDSKMAQGMNMGILALLGVVGIVLCGMAGFFVTLAVRATRSPASAGDPGARPPAAPVSKGA